MSPMKSVLAASIATLLSACGGGTSTQVSDGDSNNSNTIAPTSVSGQVADGYLVGAKVCLDLNANLACDADEPSDITTEDGHYSLAGVTEEMLSQYAIVTEIIEGVTVDQDDNLPVASGYVLTAPLGHLFLSPLSTLVANELESNPELSVEEARTNVAASLGLDAEEDLLIDYVKEQKTTMHESARKIALLLGDGQDEVESLTGNSELAKNTREIMKMMQEKIREQAKELMAENLEALKERRHRGEKLVKVIEEGEDIHERIDEWKQKAEFETASMTALLEQGPVHLIHFDMERGLAPTLAYTTLTLDSANSTVTETDFILGTSGTWEEDLSRAQYLQLTANGWELSLQNTWVLEGEEDDVTTVSQDGVRTMDVKASTMDLSGLSIAALHFSSLDEDETEAVFSDGATAARIVSKLTQGTYLYAGDIVDASGVGIVVPSNDSATSTPETLTLPLMAEGRSLELTLTDYVFTQDGELASGSGSLIDPGYDANARPIAYEIAWSNSNTLGDSTASSGRYVNITVGDHVKHEDQSSSITPEAVEGESGTQEISTPDIPSPWHWEETRLYIETTESAPYSTWGLLEETDESHTSYAVNDVALEDLKSALLHNTSTGQQ